MFNHTVTQSKKENGLNISKTCRLFGLSRQAYYQRIKRLKLKADMLSPIRGLVLDVRRKMPRLGTRKLYYRLKKRFISMNIKVGRDALFDYLREQDMLVKPKRNYSITTYSYDWIRKYPNLLKDYKVTRVEEVFVSDITYLTSDAGTHYLSLVTDAYSRKIMGYEVSNEMKASDVVKALRKAAKKRVTTLPLIHHSDRGNQYCSKLYQRELEKHNIVPSMTDGYDCYQNALAERINGILKQEFLLYKCRSLKEIKELVTESISIYNEDRPHLSLGMQTPNEVHKKSQRL